MVDLVTDEDESDAESEEDLSWVKRSSNFFKRHLKQVSPRAIVRVLVRRL